MLPLTVDVDSRQQTWLPIISPAAFLMTYC